MTLFPFIKGQIELKNSKQEFVTKVRSLTEKDLHYLEVQPTFGNRFKKYNLESYGKYFLLWKIPETPRSSFTKTIIHCRLAEINDKLYLQYQIRYNLFGYAFFIIFISLNLFIVIDFLLNSSKEFLKLEILNLILFLLILWDFNDEAKDDLEFIHKITE